MNKKDVKIITVSGKAGAGKDTFAVMLKEELEKTGEEVLIAHYGDLVKYVAAQFFEWDGEKNEKGRALLQMIGTDIVRKQQHDYWLNFIMDILYFFPVWDYVIIPDARFENEIIGPAEYYDVTSVEIQRNFKSTLTKEAQAHISENALDGFPFDFIVHNDSLEQLKESAEVVCSSILDEATFEVNKGFGA